MLSQHNNFLPRLSGCKYYNYGNDNIKVDDSFLMKIKWLGNEKYLKWSFQKAFTHNMDGFDVLLHLNRNCNPLRLQERPPALQQLRPAPRRTRTHPGSGLNRCSSTWRTWGSATILLFTLIKGFLYFIKGSLTLSKGTKVKGLVSEGPH